MTMYYLHHYFTFDCQLLLLLLLLLVDCCYCCHSLSKLSLQVTYKFFFGDIVFVCACKYVFVVCVFFSINQNIMQPLISYHRFISFTLYVIGFVWFVLSLVKRYYLRQFSLVSFGPEF